MEHEPAYIKIIHDGQDAAFIPVIPKEGCTGVYTITLDFLKSCLEDAPITALISTKEGGEPKYLLMREPGHIIEVHDLTLVYKTRFKKGKDNQIY